MRLKRAESSRPRPRPRQADIARLAGVSQGTVSLIINGRDTEGRIPSDTRDRVLDVARTLGYVPDPAARRLAGGQNKLIGIFTFESVFPLAQHDFYYPFLLGIEARAEQLGYDLVLFTGATQSGGTRGVFVGGQNRIGLADGSIILGKGANTDDIARLRDEGYPFTLLGRRDLPGDVSFVSANYREATVAAFAALVDLGHTRVAYVAGEDDTEPARDRNDGFRDACNLFSDLTPIATTTKNGRLAPTELDDMIVTGVTAIVCHFAEAAAEIVGDLALRGIDVPGDASVLALNDPAEDPSPMGGFRIPRREMGGAATDLLVAQIEGRQTKQAAHLALPIKFTTGHTVAISKKQAR